MQNFYKYLSSKGLLDRLETASDEEIKLLKAEYRKEYKKEYNKIYRREKMVHRVVIFTPDEFNFLKKSAAEYKKSFSGFVKESALAYLNQEFILPTPEQTRKVLVALTKYGTNLNQIAHHANTHKTLFSGQISDIQNSFRGLNNQVTRIYQHPYKLEDVLEQTLNKNPTYIEQIKPILTRFYHDC